MIFPEFVEGLARCCALVSHAAHDREATYGCGCHSWTKTVALLS